MYAEDEVKSHRKHRKLRIYDTLDTIYALGKR